jgi:drug/metabolite transporter (DMT)-like permease
VVFFRLIENAGHRAVSAFLVPSLRCSTIVLFLGETVTPWMLICALVIVGGTALQSGDATELSGGFPPRGEGNSWAYSH